MRDIKFRAWCEEDQDMFVVTAINFNDGTVSNENAVDEYEYDFDDVEIMQYTGLKDCKGKEIYEGDILEYGAFRLSSKHIKNRFVVHSIEDLYFNEQLDYVFSNSEIIGSKYMNPELMPK